MDRFSLENTSFSTSKQIWRAFEINLSGVKHKYGFFFYFNLASVTLTHIIYTLHILLLGAFFNMLTFVFI
jgi:hypothetical protein